MTKVHPAPLLALFLCAACGLGGSAANRYVPAEVGEDVRLDRFLDEMFQQRLDHDPELATRLGDRRNQQRWTDRSARAAEEARKLRARELLRLRRDSDRRDLPLESRIVHRAVETSIERALAAAAWRLHECTLPSAVEIGRYVRYFLTEVHRIESEDDAQAYVARLRGLPALFAQVVANLEEAAADGILPARATLTAAIADCSAVLADAPFVEGSSTCVFLAHLEHELAGLPQLDQDRSDSLLASTRSALLDAVGPAYHALEKGLAALVGRGTEDRGVWRLPRGEEFYAFLIARYASMPQNVVELHGSCEAEVDRLEQEMRGQMVRMGVDGDLQSLFARMRTDPAVSDDEAGRRAVLECARGHLEAISLRMDEILVEPAREDLSIRARSAEDSMAGVERLIEPRMFDRDRRAAWVLDLDALVHVPLARIEALTYHRTIPGEHLAQQVSGDPPLLPPLLRASPEPAAVEGWAAYAELVPRELGFYAEPAAEMSRKAAELARVARLAADTGIHALRWSSERARDYLLTHTAEPEADCLAAVEEMLRVPGATASAVVGSQKIVALRARAKRRLGASFDLRAFHAVLLHAGALPIPLLEQRVDAWIAAEMP